MGAGADMLEEHAHFGHVPEPEALHALYQLALQPVSAQESHEDDGLFVGLRQHAGCALAAVRQHVLHKRPEHRARGMPADAYEAFTAVHRYDGLILEPSAYAADECVGEVYHMARAAVVLGHFDEASVRFLQQAAHVARVGAAELEDVLVVVSDGYDAHLLVGGHQGMHQGILLVAHVLRFVYDKYGFGYAVRLHLSAVNHTGGAFHHILDVIEVADAAQQVEAVGVECLDFDEVGGVAYESHQALLELYGRRARECEHQQLLVLDVLEQKQGCEFMDQHARLSAAGACRHHDAARLLVGDDLHLFFGQCPEDMPVLLRGDIPLYLAQAVSLEVSGYEPPVVHLEVVLHVLQGGVVVAHHQIGVFAHDMHLLYLLPVEFAEHAVVLLLVALPVVLEAADVHGIVEHQEAALEFQRPDFRQVQQCFLNVLQLHVVHAVEQCVAVGFEVVQQLDYGEPHAVVPRAALFLRLRYEPVQPSDGEVTYLHALLEAYQCRPDIGLTGQLEVVCGILFLACIAFDGQEVEQCADVLLGRGVDTVFLRIVIQLLVGDAQPLAGYMSENVILEFRESFEQALRPIFRFAGVGQVRGDVFGVGQNTFLTHTLHA